MLDTAFISESPVMQHVLRQVERIGRHPWPALVLGETGTGKERIARALHDVNPRGKFVVVDCSAMVGSLMESELFGHARGAFTGAVNQKVGLIELANGGTAFFDEIGELPLELQSKLLRVLQENEFRPVGSLASRRSEFRVIAATNRDLNNEVEKGRFRADLYYRLGATSIHLPPLRDRKGDIAALVQHFLGRYGFDQKVAPDTMAALMDYLWPGNVRELENCVKHMVIMSSGPLMYTTDLPRTIQNFLVRDKSRAMSAAVGSSSAFIYPPPEKIPPQYSMEMTPSATLAETEQREILRALQLANGNHRAAATTLGIGRTTLYRKLKTLQIKDL